MSARRKRHKFPKTTVERLSYYFRSLEEMTKRGIDTVSSEALGDKLNIKSSQIRKDLSYFGYFGKRGMGYDVRYLLKELRNIIGLDREWQIVVVGAGHLGKTLAHYPGFDRRGFKIKAVFDVDPEKIGAEESDVQVKHVDEMAEFIKENDIEIAVIAVPNESAQKVSEALVEAGIKAILNFAPVTLNVPEGVRILSVDLTTKLEALAYYMSFSKDKLWKIDH